MTSDSVDFIDENDAGSILFALLKQIAHAARAHAHEHFHEIRSRDREKWNICLARDSSCQQGLTGSRRPYQQHSFGNPSAKLLELLRLAQELDDLPQLFLGFFYTRHVLERDLLLLHREQPRPALSER